MRTLERLAMITLYALGLREIEKSTVNSIMYIQHIATMERPTERERARDRKQAKEYIVRLDS